MNKILEYIDSIFEVFYAKNKSNNEMPNCIGDIINNFEDKLKDNHIYSRLKLDTEFTLLFFNTPECDNCLLVKNYIATSTIINGLVEVAKLAVLSTYSDDNSEYWTRIKHPSNWINSCDSHQSILSYEQSNFEKIPTLYLLDRDKRVILKDATLRQLEARLYEISQRLSTPN